MTKRLTGIAVVCALCATLAAAGVSAQEDGGHAAHHPQNTMNSTSPPPGPAPDAGGSRTAGGMTGMMAGMMADEGEMEGEGHHGRRGRNPFYSRLLSYGELTASQRADLAKDADRRVHDGTKLVEDAAMRSLHSVEPAQRLRAADDLAEGARLLREGASAQGALSAPSPQQVALDWYRRELAIPNGEHEPGIGVWGLSSSHLLLMVFLALVSAGLIVLQLLRLQRIRRLVSRPLIPAVAGANFKSGTPQPATLPSQATTIAPATTPAAGPALAPSNAAAAGAASLRKPRNWTGDLRVTQIVRETPTVRTFRLAEPSADRLPFDFLPGQFLQVEVQPEPEKSARRSYTIASSPTQRAYVEITVKREEQGAVSRFLHDRIKVGDSLKISGPFGAFTFTGSDADSIVLIAGGVGITPMMSVLRYLTDIAWPADIFFLYGARSTEEFVFRDELERLERRFDNLHVLAAMQRAAGTVWLGPEGPLTREMLATAVPDIGKRRVHLCGPPPMMAAVRQQLADLGVPQAQIRTEAFGPASLPVEPVAIVEPGDAAALAPSEAAVSRTAPIADTTITFSISGVSAPLPADRTVLEAAEGAGVEIPYACRSGECGACVVKLQDGEVTMAVESGLAPDDKASGYILACQAKACGKPLVVEA